MMQHRTGTDAKIGVVNGFRGIAILMVVLHHLFIPCLLYTSDAADE